MANTLKQHLKSKVTPHEIYSQNGIYQLQCGECLLKYFGQTGRPFRERCREHINALRANEHYNSKFAEHILETRHVYNTIDQTMEILHIARKGQKLITLER
jgi:hypothetical protein